MAISIRELLSRFRTVPGPVSEKKGPTQRDPTKGAPGASAPVDPSGVAKEDQRDAVPKVRDVAWSFPSLIYSLADFPRYNPDDLIGRKGHVIYRKMMLDEQVKACVKFKRDAITARDWYFELKDCPTAENEEEAERRCDVMSCALSKIQGSVSDALNNVMSAMYNGFSITEPVDHQFTYDSKTYWGLKRLRLKPYDTFYFTPDEYGGIQKFEQWVSGERQKLNIEDFVHFVMNPDVDEHYGQSELREAYRAYFSKDNIIKFRNIWLERHAGGARWIQSAKEGGAAIMPNSPEYAVLQNILVNWQTATGAIIPRGLEMHMEYPNNNVAYKEAIDDCDMQIARSLLVPNLLGISPQGEHGSLAQSDTQLEAFFWTLDADAERLADCLNEQLFWRYGRLNFGDDDIPQFKFKPVSDKRMMELIKLWKELVTASAVRATDTDEAHIRELLEMPEPGEDLNPPALIGPDGKPIPGAKPGDPKKPGDPAKPDDEKKGEPGETVRGYGTGPLNKDDEKYKRAKLSALRRVDFTVIKRRAENVVAENALKLGATMGEAVRDVFKTIEANNLVQEGKETQVAALKFDGGLKAKLRRQVQGALKDSWEGGLRHAANEIDKAKGEHFSRNVDGTRVTLIGAEFFDAKSFTITGKLTDDAINKIKQIILNGVKNGRSQKQVEDEIIDTFAKDGMLSRQDVLDYFGEAVDYSNPQARMETIIRTSSFEAINEARYAYFSDPALGGFVEALEYSAILDDRTTEICEQLDGHVHPTDDGFWDTYTPPNHFNCRSLIVPVTQRDTWSETDDNVTTQPQKGFG